MKCLFFQILIHSETQNEGKLFYENNELNIMEAKQPCPKDNDEQQSIYGCAILSTRRVEAGAITVRFGHGQKKDESPGLKAMMGRLEPATDRDQVLSSFYYLFTFYFISAPIFLQKRSCQWMVKFDLNVRKHRGFHWRYITQLRNAILCRRLQQVTCRSFEQTTLRRSNFEGQ